MQTYPRSIVHCFYGFYFNTVSFEFDVQNGLYVHIYQVSEKANTFSRTWVSSPSVSDRLVNVLEVVLHVTHLVMHRD